MHALRSRERGCFLVVQTLWAEKNQSTTDAGSLNTFGRNEIEVAPISSALLRIACLVILYKTCRVPDQELAADGVSRARLLISKMKIAVMVRPIPPVCVVASPDPPSPPLAGRGDLCVIAFLRVTN